MLPAGAPKLLQVSDMKLNLTKYLTRQLVNLVKLPAQTCSDFRQQLMQMWFAFMDRMLNRNGLRS